MPRISSGQMLRPATSVKVTRTQHHRWREPASGADQGGGKEVLAWLGRSPELDERASFIEILAVLRRAQGIDFSKYRESFVQRRIERRAKLRNFRTLQDYLVWLRLDPGEMGALTEDLLLEVTSFFRDPEAFHALAQNAIPEIIRGKQKGETIRVWVPGCSTGEEAYSIAICLAERLGENALGLKVRIFATDVNESVLAEARLGFYARRIESVVSRPRLERFFVATRHGYQVATAIRHACIFGRQDILKDPPFANLDLISCRNLLIYFKRAAQERVFQLFDYALKPGGFLMLGRSEKIGSCLKHFTSLDSHWCIYRKTPAASGPGQVIPGWGRNGRKAA